MSDITSTIASDLEFPKLMVDSDTGAVLLFDASGQGMVLTTTFSSVIGTYLTGITMTTFSDYDNNITIGN